MLMIMNPTPLVRKPDPKKPLGGGLQEKEASTMPDITLIGGGKYGR
jgi:hypothetical protein